MTTRRRHARRRFTFLMRWRMERTGSPHKPRRRWVAEGLTRELAGWMAGHERRPDERADGGR